MAKPTNPENLQSVAETSNFYSNHPEGIYRSKQCPQCKHTASGVNAIDAIFGHRWSKGHFIPGSWCKACRRAQLREKRKLSGVVYQPNGLFLQVSGRHKRPEHMANVPSVVPVITDAATILRKRVETQRLGVLHVDGNIDLPDDRDELKKLYMIYFPKDSNGSKRAWKFMVEKLMKKLGTQLILSDLAKAKLGK